MRDENLQRVPQTVDPAQRAIFNKVAANAAFTIPVVASFPVKELGAAAMARMTTTSRKVSIPD